MRSKEQMDLFKKRSAILSRRTLVKSPVYDGVWEDPDLSKRDRSLITVAALVCMGRMDELVSCCFGFTRRDDNEAVVCFV